MVQVDAILEPVADAVSELIVFAATCEENGTPMPDLTSLSEMVLGATQGLVQVALEMTQSTRDEELKGVLPEAAQKVQGAAQRLDMFCKSLLGEPNDAPAREGMVGACKTILDGMRDLLEATNDSEVRRILKACQEAAKFTKMVTMTATESDFVSVSQHFSTAATTLVRLANARLEEVTHVEIVTRLAAALELVRTNAPLVISSHKSVLQANGAAAVKTREFVVSDLASAIQEIATVVQIRMSSVSSGAAGDSPRAINLVSIQSSLRDCLTAALQGDAEALSRLQAQLDEQFAELLSRARAAAEVCQDEDLKAELTSSADAVEASLGQTKAAQTALCNEPESEAKLATAKAAQAELETLATALTAILKQALLLQARTALEAMPSSLAGVFRAAQSGAADTFREASLGMGSNSKLMVNGSRTWSEYIDMEDIISGIKATTAILERKLPQVVTAASTILQEPTNGPAKEHLANLTKSYQVQLTELEKLLVESIPLDTAILALLARIQTQFAVLDTNIAAQEGTVAVLTTTSLTTKHNTLTDLANTWSAGELDATSREATALADATATLASLVPSLKSTVDAAVSGSGDGSASRNLGALVSSIKYQNSIIDAVVRGRDLPNAAAAMASAREAAIAAMGGMMAAAAVGNTAAAMAYLRQGDAEYRRQIALAREAAAEMESLLQRKAVLDACDALEADLEVLATAAEEACADPNNADKQAALAAAVDQCEADSAAIEHALNNTPTEKEEVAELLDVAPRTLDAMEAAVQEGDVQRAQAVAGDAAEQYARIGQLATQIDVDDPDKSARAAQAAENIATASAALEDAAVAAAQAPQDHAAQDSLGAVTQALRYNAGQVERALRRDVPAEQEMAELRSDADEAYAAMQTSAAAGQVQTTAQYVKQVEDINSRYTALAREQATQKLADNPAAQESARAAAQELDAHTAELDGIAAAAAASPNDAAAADELAAKVVAMQHCADKIERSLASTVAPAPEAEFSTLQVRGASALDAMVVSAKDGKPKVAGQYAAQAFEEYEALVANAGVRAESADPVVKSVAEGNIAELNTALATLREAHDAYQANPEDASTVAALETAAEGVKEATSTLEATLNGELNPQQEYANTVIHADATMEQLVKAVNAGDTERANALAVVAEEQNRRLATVATALAEDCSAEDRAIVMAACERLNSQLDSMATVVAAASSDPNNAHAMDAFEAMVAAIATEKEKISSVLGTDGTGPGGAAAAAAAGGAVMTATYLATSGDNSPEAVAARAAMIEELMGEGDSLLDDIRDAATAGKVQTTKVLSARGVEKYETLTALVNAQADSLEDPVAASIVRAKAGDLNEQMAAVAAAADTTAANPEDADAVAALDTSIRTLQGTVATIDDGLKGKLDAKEVVATLVATGAENLAKVETAAAAGDTQGALAARKQAEADYTQLLAAAASLESGLETEDAKEDLRDAMEAIEEELEELKVATSKAANAPEDEDAQDELADSTHVIRHNANNVSRILRGQDPLPDPLAVEEEEEEISQDPLMAAAQQVTRSANKWDASENEMVAMAAQIGELMAVLAAAQQAGDKKGLIEAAREINKLCAKVHKMAEEILKTCGDKRLKRQLEIVMEMLPNFGMKLKIMAAVQASSLVGDRPDPQSLESLIICAQGLSDAVSRCISASQAASITSVKAAVNVVSAVLKWKKLRKKKK